MSLRGEVLRRQLRLAVRSKRGSTSRPSACTLFAPTVLLYLCIFGFFRVYPMYLSCRWTTLRNAR